MIKDTLQADLKAAMLDRDSARVEVLKSLKSAILYVEVAENKREQGLSDDEVLAVFSKESKKRQDSADLFMKGGAADKAETELAEKAIIDSYLPDQMSEEDINKVIEEVISSLGVESLEKKDMGRVIGAVKSQLGAQADGAVIAKLVGAKVA